MHGGRKPRQTKLTGGTRGGFEPVSAKTQPVSGPHRSQNSDIENSSSRDSPRNPRSSMRNVRYFPPQTGLSAAILRKCRQFTESGKTSARARGGWLGRQDSNLGMAESK